MQKVIYTCDNPKCGREIGPKKHISLVLDRGHQACGIAIPPSITSVWRVRGLPKGFIHFCSGKCIGQYFGDLIKADEKSNGKNPQQSKGANRG